MLNGPHTQVTDVQAAGMVEAVDDTGGGAARVDFQQFIMLVSIVQQCGVGVRFTAVESASRARRRSRALASGA